ncbi:porin [Vibrio penaeicida]|uniref:Membrane protein n=1 Tax=Vibrio penaeicida TaxID=104609 RepID=A0AAV5P0E7_9VIBR|nr:porin [Vibrio penaeicida]GLQ76039.1 membrane protein [Vibrio penaeicida]
MNKAILATAILSAMTLSSASAVTIYEKDGTVLDLGGRAEGRFNVSDANKTGNKGAFKDISRARISLSGESAVTDQFSGFGKYEAELSGEEDLTNRYYFAGVKGEFGSVSYGKQDSSQVMLSNFTDTLATFGAKAADIVDGNKDKRENALVYKTTFDQLTVSGDYIFADKDNNDNTNSYGISGVYSLERFRIGAGYVNQKQGDETENQFNFVGEVQFDNLSFSGLYTMGKSVVGSQLNDIIGYELMAKYELEKVAFVGAYNAQKNDSSKTDTVDEFALESVYTFNEHLRTYVGYRINQIKDADNELQMGLRYDF